MLTEVQVRQLDNRQVEAIFWADSYLWPDAQDVFEEWVVAAPENLELWEEDNWHSFSVCWKEHLRKVAESEAREQERTLPKAA